jgi:hypothetical protein
MATEKKATTETASKPKNVVIVGIQHGETEDAATARVLTKPEILAAWTLHDWQGGITEVNVLASELSEQIGKVNSGNMKRAEAMLLAQAHTLDGLFNNLARRAHKQDGIALVEPYLRLALKAQSQCRTTLETLAAIKNPPVIFAKQANISGGHQQINNGTTTPATHGGEIKNQQTKILEAQDGGTTLDTATTGATIADDKAMATVD